MSIKVHAEYLSIQMGVEVLKEWGYTHYLEFAPGCKMGGSYDDGVLTRILMYREEGDDTIKWIAYAEKNPKSTLIEAVEAARTLYGRTPKKIYAICHTMLGLGVLNFLKDNHPDAADCVNVKDRPISGDVEIAYTRKK